MKEWYVIYEGDITNPQMRNLFAIVSDAVNTGVDRVYLAINSQGGDTNDAIAFYNVMKTVPLKFATYNLSAVSSAAVILFLGGNDRVCVGNNSYFMLHRSRRNWKIAPGQGEMTAAIAMCQLEDAATMAIVNSNAKLSSIQIGIFNTTDLVLNASDAIAAGIANSTGLFSPPPGSRLLTA